MYGSSLAMERDQGDYESLMDKSKLENLRLLRVK